MLHKTHMTHKTHKRPRLAVEKRAAVVSEDPSDDEDAGSVTQDGDRVFFYADVSRKSVLELVTCLAKANEHALRTCTCVQAATVYVYIHSAGGDAYAGLSAFDHIHNNKVPVTTIIDGFVASAATFILLGGEYRVAMKHSNMLIHQLKTTFWGKFSDLVDEMDNSKSLMETIKQIYSENTQMSKKKIDCLLSKEKNMDAARCLSLGFVQELW